MIDDLFNSQEEDEEEDFSHLIPACEEAMTDGKMDSLRFSEEEYEFLLNNFIMEGNDNMVNELARLAYVQHPYSADLVIRYADVLIVRRETEKAKEILQNLLERTSDNGDIYFLIGRACLKSGEHEEAKENINKAVALLPDEAAEMFHTAAQDYIDLAEFERALDYLIDAEAADSSDTELYNDVAFCYERLNRFEESLVYYEKYLDQDPFNDNVWFNVGTIHARELRFDKSLEAFDYAIALNPENSSVLYNKAIVYVNTENFQKGIDTFTEFLKFEPDNIFAIVGIAEALLAMDNLPEAARYYQEALTLEKGNQEANSGLALISMLNHDHYSALVYLRRVIGSESVDYNFLSGQLLIEFKRTLLPEFLVYYLVALYYTHSMDSFVANLEVLLTMDELWLKKLYELVPKLKKDIAITKKISKLREK